jgi:hypothetical protein
MKGLFWLTVLEALVHGHLLPLLLALWQDNTAWQESISEAADHLIVARKQ